MDSNRERIFFDAFEHAQPVTFSAGTNADSIGTLTGYAMVWNVLSGDRGGYQVRLLPGSASFLTPTFAIYNHNYDNVFARNDDGTLRTFFDDIGCRVEIDVPDTQAGNDVYTLVKRGTIRGMSFAMLSGGTYEDITEGETRIRAYSAFEADEVTITPIPSFDQTTIGVADSHLSDWAKELSEQYAKVCKYKLDAFTL